MQFLILVYIDDSLMQQVPQEEFNTLMRGCIHKMQDFKRDGKLLDAQQLEPAQTAKTVRIRGPRRTVSDGPFAETKEVLGGFNLVEAENMDEALKIAEGFPWARFGSLEIRPVRSIAQVARQVGA